MRYAIGRINLPRFAACEGGRLYAYPTSLDEAKRLARQALEQRELRLPPELGGRFFEKHLFPGEEMSARELYMPACSVATLGFADDIILVDGDGINANRYSHIRVLESHQAEIQLAYETDLRNILWRGSRSVI